MSHYRSGRYYVELNKRQEIENACQEQLRRAQAERDAARSAVTNLFSTMRQEEQQLAHQAEATAQQARTGLQERRDARAAWEHRAQELLDQIRDEVGRLEVVYRDYTAVSDLQLVRNQLMQMYQMEDTRGEFLARAEQFLAAELPQWKQRLETGAQEAFTRACAENVAPITVKGEDRSEQFVSLQGTIKAARTAEKISPWDDFCTRVERLLERMGDMASEELYRLEEDMRATAPAKRNHFLRNNQKLLQQLEAEAADLLGEVEQGEQALEDQTRKYHALCDILGCSRVSDPEGKGYAWLLAENDRLWRICLLREEEAYVDRNLEEVFAQFGIRFDNLETAASEDGSVQMQCDLPNATRLTMKKSAGGAFAMEFTGVSASSSVSMDERRRVAAEAQSFCKLMPKISEELKRRGIGILSPYQEEPTAENIRIVQGAVRNTIHTEKKVRTMK